MESGWVSAKRVVTALPSPAEPLHRSIWPAWLGAPLLTASQSPGYLSSSVQRAFRSG